MFSISVCVLKVVAKRIRGLNRFKTDGNRFGMHISTSKNCGEIPLYSMRIKRCCANLYKKWYDYGINKKKPLNGVDLNVVYADSMPAASSNVPVIVGLHGIGGSHRTFTPLWTHLEQSSKTGTPVRVILPNFPGWGFTECDANKIFGHSEAERAAFVIDFLNAINVNKVHVLITHDASFYVASDIHEQSDRVSIESLALINPLGLKPLRVSKPIALNRFLLKAINLPFVRDYVAKTKDPTFNIKSEQVEIMLKYILYVDYEQVRLWLLSMAFQQFLLFVAFSNDDPLIKPDVSNEIIDSLNLSDDSISKYDNIVSTAKDRYPKAMIFDKGGHNLLTAYSEILAKEILNLLSHAQRKRTLISSRNDVVYLKK